MVDRPQDALRARELLEISGRLDDDEKDRGKTARTIYAIDSNIAIFLSDPSRHASSRMRQGAHRVGFGAIFDSDPAELNDVVAHALAEHLYLELRKFGPLLVIPPITEELHPHFLELTDAFENPTAEEMKKWEAEALVLIGQLERLERFKGPAEELIPEVQQALFLLYGPAAALRRLKHLLTGLHLVSSDIASRSDKIISDDKVRRALAPPRSAWETAYLTYRARKWMDGGLHTGREKREKNAFRDGYVMARLEQMNIALETAKSPAQIVYVSADRNLIDVVQRAENPYLQVRHPRSWLPRISIFERQEDEHRETRKTRAKYRKVGDLLSDLLRGEEIRTSLEDFLTVVAHAHEEKKIRKRADAKKLKERWHEYLEKATASFVPREETKNLFFDRSRKMVERYSSKIERFRADIDSLREITWEECFAAMLIIAATEAQSSDRHYARTVAPLIFELWEETQRTLDEFLQWHTAEEFDSRAFSEGLARIDKQDDTRYARYTVLATIFASRSEWEMATSAAKRAFERVEPRSALVGGPNGRESSFVEAVCRRHIAKDEKDLDYSTILLGRAEQIAELELENVRPDERDIVPERFVSERIACDITRFYFNRYAEDGSIRTSDQPRLEQLMKELGKLFHTLLERRDRDLPYSGPVQRAAREQILQRTIVNILGLALIDGKQRNIVDLAWREAEKLNMIAEIDSKGQSNLSRATLLAYKRIALGGKSRRDTLALREQLADKTRLHVFPYDQARFAEIERNAFRA